jgi:hypothetical protein
MRLKILSAVLSAAVVALVSGHVGASDAPQYRGGANHPGAAGESVTLTALTSLTQLYSINTGSSKVFADPVVSGDRLIIVNQGGDVLCLNAATGAPFWSKNAGEPIFATPAISNGRVFVGTEMGKLIAYDLENGAVAWQVSHGGQQLGAPVAAGGMIIVAAGFGNESLTAYSETTGTVVWTRTLDRFIQSPPAVYGDKVVYAMPDGTIMALQLSSGADAWTSKAQGQAIYFGIAPAIVADPDSSDVYIYAAPGDDVVGTGTNSITGFKKYATYKVKLADGTLSKVVPGTVGTSAASTGRGTREPSAPTATAPEAGPVDLRDCPQELLEELSRLNDLASQIKVIEEYEKINGISMAAYKAELTASHARMAAYKAARATAASGAASTRASSTGHATLQTSSFDTNWPSAGMIKPAPVAYLSHGTMRYMAIMMQEIPTISVAPRTLLFSVNPAAGGELRWMYSTDTATVSDRPVANGGALLVPTATDPNGAYILAGIGDAVGVFDASAGNTPLFQIDMQAPVYATPVLSNGKIFIVDSSGLLKAFSTPNSAPTVPLILAPAANADLQSLPSPTATWQPSTDDSTAQNALAYVIRSSINGDFAHDATDMVLAPNVTGYTWSGVDADSEITFAVRAMDGQEASSAWSAPRTFYYKKDTIAPAAVSGLVATPGAVALSVTFTASADESPNGAKDVVNYRITVSEGATALFTVDAGLSHTVVINGATPATPLIPGHTYTVAVTAYDRRGNASPVTSVTASAVLDGPDITAPTVLSATLFDADHNGWVETAELTMSEKISTLAGDFVVSAFFLNGLSAVSGTVDNTKLTLSFGSGAEGTGPAPVTFDAAFGTIKDLSGNPLATFGPNDLAEIDAAPPVMMGGSLQFHDDDKNGHPDRLTVDFSESIAASSIELADVAAVRDPAGTALIPMSATLLPNGVTLEITFDNLTGVMTDGDRPQLVLTNNGNGTFFSDTTGNQFSGILLNEPPVVSVSPAFGNRTFNPGMITLDATASTDPDGPSSGLAFEWRVTAFVSAVPAVFYPSKAALLTGNKAAAGIARLLLTEPGLYSVVLNVTDAASNTESTTITFSVKNAAPRAVVVSEVSAPVGSTAVVLDGRQSRDDNSRDGLTDLVAYRWLAQSGPVATQPILSNQNLAVATADFTGLPEGRYFFELIATDRAGLFSTASVSVKLFSPSNLPPVAVAGPDRRVAVLRPVILDGRFSRDDHPENLTYEWRVTEGTGLTMSGTSTATATIIPTSSGRSRIELTVSDGLFASTDALWLEVFDPAARQYLPTAKATAPARAAVGASFNPALPRSQRQYRP